MKRFKQILKKLCCLPPLPTVLIALPSFVFVFVNLGAENKSPLAYVSYGLSAYAVIITSTGIAGMIKAAKNGWDEMPLMKKIPAIRLETSYWEMLFFARRLPFTAAW